MIFLIKHGTGEFYCYDHRFRREWFKQPSQQLRLYKTARSAGRALAAACAKAQCAVSVVDMSYACHASHGRFYANLPGYTRVGETLKVFLDPHAFLVLPEQPLRSDGELSGLLLMRRIDVGNLWQELSARYARRRLGSKRDRQLKSLEFTLRQIDRKMSFRGLLVRDQ